MKHEFEGFSVLLTEIIDNTNIIFLKRSDLMVLKIRLLEGKSYRRLKSSSYIDN